MKGKEDSKTGGGGAEGSRCAPGRQVGDRYEESGSLLTEDFLPKRGKFQNLILGALPWPGDKESLGQEEKPEGRGGTRRGGQGRAGEGWGGEGVEGRRRRGGKGRGGGRGGGRK